MFTFTDEVTTQKLSNTTEYSNHNQQQTLHREKSNKGCLRWFIFTGIALVLFAGILVIGYLVVPIPSANILVVGIDSRGNEGTAARTDSIMVVNVNSNSARISLLSIPRSLWVNVPNYGSQMINTAHFLGEYREDNNGLPLLKQTIEDNFGIRIDHYVRMDFAGFVNMINAVGGIHVDVPYVLEDFEYPTADYGTIYIRFEEGPQWLDGENALIYARTRHSDDDYRRAERQQQVLVGFVKSALNPTTWGALLDVLNQSVETDLSITELVTIAPAVGLSGGQLNQLVIDREYILPGSKGPIPNYEALEPFITENFQ
jgi:LCP family protein required for cell wall assembly